MCLIKASANKVTSITEVCTESDAADIRQFSLLVVDEKTLLWMNDSSTDGPA